MRALFFLLAACKSTPCPSPAVLEHMHAASFYFDHGPAEKGREQTRLAEASLRTPDTRTQAFITALKALAALPDDSAELESGAEALRADLSEWTCLDQKTHDAFHEKLPRRFTGTSP